MMLDSRDVYGCADIEEVRQRIERHLESQGVPIVADSRELVVYVNHGRWLADCPQCNNGIACSVENSNVICAECGYSYVAKFPRSDQRTKALALLDDLPRAEQNWDKGQTVKALEARLALTRGIG